MGRIELYPRPYGRHERASVDRHFATMVGADGVGVGGFEAVA